MISVSQKIMLANTIAEGISAKYDGTIVQLSTTIPNIVQIVIEVGLDIVEGVASGSISAWLYEKLRGRNIERTRIERTEVALEARVINKQ